MSNWSRPCEMQEIKQVAAVKCAVAPFGEHAVRRTRRDPVHHRPVLGVDGRAGATTLVPALAAEIVLLLTYQQFLDHQPRRHHLNLR
jgi:hypothetical protein